MNKHNQTDIFSRMIFHAHAGHAVYAMNLPGTCRLLLCHSHHHTVPTVDWTNATDWCMLDEVLLLSCHAGHVAFAAVSGRVRCHGHCGDARGLVGSIIQFALRAKAGQMADLLDWSKSEKQQYSQPN